MTADQMRSGQEQAGEVVARLLLPEGQPGGFYLLILAAFIAIVASIVFAIIAVDHARRRRRERNMAFAGKLARWTSIIFLVLLFAFAILYQSNSETIAVRRQEEIVAALSVIPLAVRPRWRVLFLTATIGLGVGALWLTLLLGYPAVIVLFPYGVIMIVAGLITAGRGCSNDPQSPAA